MLTAPRRPGDSIVGLQGRIESRSVPASELLRVRREVAEALDRAAAVPGRHLAVDQRHLRALDDGGDLGEMPLSEVVRLAAQQDAVDAPGETA